MDEYEQLKDQIKRFLKTFNRFPKYNEFKQKNGLFEYDKARKITKLHNQTIQDLLADIDCYKSLPNKKYYQQYVNRYKNYIVNGGYYVGLLAVWRKYRYVCGLPYPKWLIENAPKNSGVYNYRSFMDWAGIYHMNPSKELAIKLIYEMQRKSDHPLMYDDFRGKQYGTVSITTVRKYWGSINKMKKALGLKINQESMIDKHLSIQEIQTIIYNVCNKVKEEEHRNIITIKDFHRYGSPITGCTMSTRISKELHMTLTEYIKSIGFELLKSGRGLNFTYKGTGEKVYSQFEYLFSNMLHDLGFVFNIDYYKDIKYKDFIPSYQYNSTCDYVIHYKGRIIYIEIAGLIEAYKFYYYDSKPIESSKSKEKYRKSLHRKEQAFKNNGLEYYILFPCDLTKANLDKILNDLDHDKVRNFISHFLQNNIKWSVIREKGELTYTFNSSRHKRERYVVNY